MLKRTKEISEEPSYENKSSFEREDYDPKGQIGKNYHVPQLDVHMLGDGTIDKEKFSAIHTSLPATVQRDDTKKNTNLVTAKSKEEGTIKNSINNDLDDVNHVNIFYKTEKEPMLQSEIRILKNNQTVKQRKSENDDDYLD